MEQVLNDHVAALLRGDLPALMADYDEDSVLMTLEGTFVGLAAIEGFFANGLAMMPNLRVNPVGMQVHDDAVLVAWTAEFDTGSVPDGVDTFVVRDDKIRLQTGYFTVVPT
jgi:ketosteroid isomerase-like protein